MGEASSQEARTRLKAAGIPTFRTPDPAVEMFAHVSAFYRNQQLLMQAARPLVHQEPPDFAAARALIERALAMTGKQTKRDCTLSNEVMILVVLALGLFTELPIRMVFKACRRLRHGESSPCSATITFPL